MGRFPQEIVGPGRFFGGVLKIILACDTPLPCVPSLGPRKGEEGTEGGGTFSRSGAGMGKLLRHQNSPDSFAPPPCCPML